MGSHLLCIHVSNIFFFGAPGNNGLIVGNNGTLPKTNSKFAPTNGWLEYDPFLLGFGLFSGALVVSFREGKSQNSWSFKTLVEQH